MTKKQSITLEDLARITKNGFCDLEQRLGYRIDNVENKFDGLKKEVSSVKKEVSSVKAEVSSVKKEMRQGFANVDARFDILEKDMQKFATRRELHELEVRVTFIEEKLQIAY